ncbi:dachshund homolog 1-like isoform X5 [Branchiostoma lanceolatum]|uniref:dachshund homolog 1-like isoform X5 n=1 Tax=Branchiostoma lanceolatum TaxID=7740 RepID=UPI00345674C9
MAVQPSPPLPSPGHGLSPPQVASPLGLFKLDKPAYSTPPPAENTPANNVCRMIDYRGAKVAAFTVDGREVICLPQAFDLFLKHLVGGLHTVYTKLKRLDITPVVCNVEQVRILRGLGAIQPGVNRCKLLSKEEFDVLYEDCTNSSSRPGRPPKRAHPSLMPPLIHDHKKMHLENGDFDFTGHTPIGTTQNGFHLPASSSVHACQSGLHGNLVMSNAMLGLTPAGIVPPVTEGVAASGGLEGSAESLRERLTTERSSLESPDSHSEGNPPLQSLVGMAPFLSENISSTETILTNIMGLIKVAADNARQQEKQFNMEKGELKMELLRERELREALEKQLGEEQRSRAVLQKRLKKEKKAKRKMLEQLEQEQRRRIQAEDGIKQTSSDSLRVLNESLSQELEVERNARTDAERKLQDAQLYFKNLSSWSSLVSSSE